jgi:hypothetical protein
MFLHEQQEDNKNMRYGVGKTMEGKFLGDIGVVEA